MTISRQELLHCLQMLAPLNALSIQRASSNIANSSFGKQSPHATRTNCSYCLFVTTTERCSFVWRGAKKTLGLLKCSQLDCECGNVQPIAIVDLCCSSWNGLLFCDTEVLQDNCCGAVASVVILSMQFLPLMFTLFILECFKVLVDSLTFVSAEACI